MSKTANAYERLIQNYTQWASEQPGILSVIIWGSRATPDPADDHADLDFVTFATHPGRFLSQSDWINKIGEVITSSRWNAPERTNRRSAFNSVL